MTGGEYFEGVGHVMTGTLDRRWLALLGDDRITYSKLYKKSNVRHMWGYVKEGRSRRKGGKVQILIGLLGPTRKKNSRPGNDMMTNTFLIELICVKQ
jgi:hypothetical protein